MHVWNTGRKNDAKKLPSTHHRTTLSGYILQLRHVLTVGKNFLSSNIFSTWPYNMVNFGPLAAEIVSLVWGAPANFNGFRVLASLLQRRRSMEANQTLHNVWPSPAWLHYIYIFGGYRPVTEFCQVQNSVCILQVLRSPIFSITAWHSSSRRKPNFAALSTGRHLYSAGRPLRWALAHILVLWVFGMATVNIFASVKKMMGNIIGWIFFTFLNGWLLHGSSLHSSVEHCDFWAQIFHKVVHRCV